MFFHKTCGFEVGAKVIQHQYCPILSLEQGHIEVGDMHEAYDEDTLIHCGKCGKDVDIEDVGEK